MGVQLEFQGIEEGLNSKEQRRLVKILVSVLQYSLELQEGAAQMKGADSAQRKLTQVMIAQEIQKRIRTA